MLKMGVKENGSNTQEHTRQFKQILFFTPTARMIRESRLLKELEPQTYAVSTPVQGPSYKNIHKSSF